MATPFGFSAGDIAMAIKFIAQVANALKETGGAVSDYREVLKYLEGLLLTLQHLQQLDTRSADPSLVKAIRALTAAAEQPVRDFVAEMGKYGKAMGEERSVVSGFRKAEWAVVAAKKADKLRLKIAAQMQPIQLLMESQTLHCFDAAAELNRELKSEVEEHAAQQVVFNQRLLDTLATLQKAVKTANSIGKASEQPIPKDDEMTVVKSAPFTSSVEELTRLGEQFCVVIWHLLQDLKHLIALILLISPQLLSHLRVWYQSMVRAPGWLLDENIHFENALGEPRSLPFAYFRHIRVFEAFLETDFHEKPGEFQVMLHHYQILTPDGLRLDRKSWARLVRPGGHIHMSMNIPRHVDEILPVDDPIQGQRTVATHEQKSKSPIWVYKTCPDCGLQFFAMPKFEPVLYRSHDGPPTTLLKGDEVYHGVKSVNLDNRKPRDMRHRLLALDSGDVLPFKRMHIFGRAGRRVRHSKPDLYVEPAVEADKMEHLSSHKPELLPEACSVMTGAIKETHTTDICDLDDDIEFNRKHTSDQESAYNGSTSHLRCDNAKYHVRPIISMITMNKKVLSWFSRSKQRPKQPSAQTLTCQASRCSRTFEDWKELDQHYRDEHGIDGMLDDVVGAAPPKSAPPLEFRREHPATVDAREPLLAGPDAMDHLYQRAHTPIVPNHTDQSILNSLPADSVLPLHGGNFYPSVLQDPSPSILEEKVVDEAPSSVHLDSGGSSIPFDYDSDEYWVGC